MPHVRTPLAAALCALALTAPWPAAFAQDADSAGGVDASGPKPRVWIEPRISAGVTLSNNGGLSAGSRSEQMLELSPGVQVVANTPGVRGYLDYSLSAVTYLQDTSPSNWRNRLAANGVVNAWDNRVFVDVAASIDRESLSVFGAPRGTSLAEINNPENRSLRVSPSFRSELGGWADLELRYTLAASDTESGARSDVTDQRASLSLRRVVPGQLLGWTANASTGETDYSLGRTTRSDTAQVGVVLQPTAQLQATVLIGRERNDILTLGTAGYSNHALSLDWRPSPRSRLAAALHKRYFGNGHDITLEHRTGLTVWRYQDSRGVQNNPLTALNASLGTVYDLFDNLFSGTEPDPVRRAQLVNGELQRLGLDPNTELLQTFLASASTLERQQSLSVALVGQRTVVTLALTRSNARRLTTLDSGVGDDFDSVSEIDQQGWSLSAAHRLTPRLSLNAALTRQRVATGLAAADSRLTSVSVGLAARLAPRTTGSVLVRRSVNSGTGTAYGETAIGGLITHRF